jgi:DNA repair protein RecO
MAHHIYQTEGIVVASFPEGEASKFLLIFTKDLGLVGAAAKSVRSEKSKLRYALQDYSMCGVSLVRGKDIWRIVNARPGINLYENLQNDRGKRSAAVRLVSLIRKLVAGEERNEVLFDAVSKTFRFLLASDLTKDELVNFQLIAALRILYHLGYVGDNRFRTYSANDEWNAALLLRFESVRNEARKEIRRALLSAHL